MASWTKKVPEKPGKYWFYGSKKATTWFEKWFKKPEEPEMIMMEVLQGPKCLMYLAKGEFFCREDLDKTEYFRESKMSEPPSVAKKELAEIQARHTKKQGDKYNG